MKLNLGEKNDNLCISYRITNISQKTVLELLIKNKKV